MKAATSPKIFLNYQQNQIMKLSHQNRLLFVRLALVFSMFACSAMIVACSTNNWLYTSEWLKYYVPDNGTVNESLPEYMQPNYYKTSTMGPWLWCWTDPRTPYSCVRVDHLQFDESSDTTTAVEIAVRIAAPIAVLTAILDVIAVIATLLCTCKNKFYRLVLTTGVLQIFTGLSSLLCLVMYVHTVTREVGKKLWPETPMDEPLFMYSYGYSFYNVIVSYLCTEIAAFLVLFVYMAKHDEQMYNRYQVRSMFKSNVLAGLAPSDPILTVSHGGKSRRNRRVSSKSEKFIFGLDKIDELHHDKGDIFLETSMSNSIHLPKCHLSAMDPSYDIGSGSSVGSLTTAI